MSNLSGFFTQLIQVYLIILMVVLPPVFISLMLIEYLKKKKEV